LNLVGELRTIRHHDQRLIEYLENVPPPAKKRQVKTSRSTAQAAPEEERVPRSRQQDNQQTVPLYTV
jgi:hypothetical protein